MKLTKYSHKPKPPESCCQKLRKSFEYLGTSYSVQTREFLENSSLHGVRYIAESCRPFAERFMWFACVTVGTIASLVIIFSLWEKFQTNPTITGLDTDFHTWKVPFPAVFLCQEVPASEERIREFLEKSSNESETTTSENKYLIEFYLDLTSLTLDNIPEFVQKYAKVIETRDVTRKSILNLMNINRDVFSSVEFGGEQQNVSDFLPLFTENGFCHSYNSRHFERGTNETTAFLNKIIKETDFKWSLAFDVFDPDVNSTIYILNSDEMLSIEVQPQVYWDHKVNKVSFSYKETYTTQDTRQLSIKQRKCVFDDEIKLQGTSFYLFLLVDEIYTYTACSMECRMKMSKRLCNCVPFFYPEVQDFPYCTLKDLMCISDNFKMIKNADNCQCNFLRCLSAVYEVEKLLFISDQIDANLTTSLEAEFVSWPMVKYKREVLFGWVDLLVSFGGIAGLFLGFSLLSAVEIVYYFTIRAWIASVRERSALDRIQAANEAQPQPSYDLSLIPYFWSDPLPGAGIDQVVKRYKALNVGRYRTNQNRITNVQPKENVWSISRTIIPPYGIEFTN